MNQSIVDSSKTLPLREVPTEAVSLNSIAPPLLKYGSALKCRKIWYDALYASI
jgi:hypothetical protein